VSIDPDSGLLRTNRGVSVQDSPTGLDRFGEPYEVTSVPPELKIVHAGRRAGHYEIAPAYPMTRAESEDAVEKVILVPATGRTDGNAS
jgi:hypothetical protein